MWCVRGVVALVAVFALCGSVLACRRPPVPQMDLWRLERALDDCFSATGRYPVSDNAGTWVEKLIEGGDLESYELEGRIINGEPVDPNGVPYVYVAPADVASERLNRWSTPLVWWPGANGVYEGGAGDDLSASWRPNPGQYYLAGRPKAVGWTILAAMAYAPLLMALRAAGVRGAWRMISLTLIYACAAWFALAGLYYPNAPLFHREDAARGAWRLLSVMGLLGLVGIDGLLALRRAAQRLGAEQLIAHERCPQCRYDLRGLAAPRCPECGSARYTTEPPAQAGGL